MSAYRLMGWQKPPEFQEMPIPTPGVGEVLIRVAGVGLCQSDIHFMDAAPGTLRYSPPYTLGHEISGWVEALGRGVTSVGVADVVGLYTIDFCARCRYCWRGHQNLCANANAGRGFGTDGGLAQFVIARESQLVVLPPSLDPRLAAPLTDAGMTSYHAVTKVLGKLEPGSTAVVLGVGGLGGFAVQHLRELTAARIVAVDITADRLQRARDLGAADTVMFSETTTGDLRDQVSGDGIDVVLDFVGNDQTISAALGAVRKLGSVIIVGAGGGAGTIRRREIPFECDVSFTLAGTPADLAAVVALAGQGRLRIDATPFPFEQASVAYDRLRAGQLSGRAVVLPNG
jgi:propanol-preferring alcohol dehydrogenase